MKVLLSIVAVIIGLVGLLMTGCGLIFTVGGGLEGIGIISVPSMLIGMALLYGAWRLFRVQLPKE